MWRLHDFFDWFKDFVYDCADFCNRVGEIVMKIIYAIGYILVAMLFIFTFILFIGGIHFPFVILVGCVIFEKIFFS